MEHVRPKHKSASLIVKIGQGLFIANIDPGYLVVVKDIPHLQNWPAAGVFFSVSGMLFLKAKL